MLLLIEPILTSLPPPANSPSVWHTNRTPGGDPEQMTETHIGDKELARAKRVFNLIAPLYRLFSTRLEQNYRKALEALSKHYVIRPDTKILDVGTGTGALAGAFASVTPDVTGIDISDRMLESARRRYGTRIGFRKLAAHELGVFRDGEFDLVTAAFVLHGFNRDYRRRVLAEMKRVAESKVVIIDFVPHRSRLMAFIEGLEGSHYHEFMAEFREDLQAVFPDHLVEAFSATSGVYICDVNDRLDSASLKTPLGQPG